MRSELKRALGGVIRSYRLKRNIPQESMGASQPYISNLERGVWSASLDKIEQMAAVLGVHPASIILAGYLSLQEGRSADELLDEIRRDLRELGH